MDKHLLTTLQKKKKGLLTRWRKEPEVLERFIVYEYMENGTLFDHLHGDLAGTSSLSPVTMSWKMRADVLLSVSRVIEHLHCHANPSIIHRDIKSSNIMFDASWVPRVTDFGVSVVWEVASEEEGVFLDIVGTFGYVAPEYAMRCLLTPACDVYSLGVVMLEVLTGKEAVSQGDYRMRAGLASFAVPIIEAGKFDELLDRRPVPEPTAGQLKALEQVAHTARCCLKLDWKDRPAMSYIVANLEMAYELICRDEPGSIDDLPNSTRASCVSSAS
ncbi:hypothetical protein ACQJBY_014155 [Aegilops geniculata]